MEFTMNSFKFNDDWNEKIPFPGRFFVKENTAFVLYYKRDRLVQKLSVGESFRSPTFSVNNNPLLDRFVFQLRVYPAGQFIGQRSFIVYLVLVECPDIQPNLPKLEITLTVVGSGWTDNHKMNKEFDWRVKQERFLRLAVPLWTIKSNIDLFSVKIEEPLKDWWIESSYQTNYRFENRASSRSSENSQNCKPEPELSFSEPSCILAQPIACQESTELEQDNSNSDIPQQAEQQMETMKASGWLSSAYNAVLTLCKYINRLPGRLFSLLFSSKKDE